MATTPATYANLLHHMIPEAYNGDQNLEDFIVDCRRFFEISKIEGEIQSILVKGFISKELIAIYESVDSKITNFEERLKIAFQKPSSLI